MLLFVCSTAVESRLVRLDTSCTVILPPMVSVLCFMDFNLNDLTSVARFVKIPPLWQVIKKIFVNTFKVYMVLGKVFSSLWHNLYGFGQIFIAINCQILKTQFGRMVTLDLFPFTAIKIWPEAKNCQRRFKMLKETISTLNKYNRLSKFCYLGNTSVSANTITLMFKMMWTWLWPHDWKIKCSERKEFQKRDWRESFKRLSNDGGLIVRVLALLLW